MVSAPTQERLLKYICKIACYCQGGGGMIMNENFYDGLCQAQEELLFDLKNYRAKSSRIKLSLLILDIPTTQTYNDSVKKTRTDFETE